MWQYGKQSGIRKHEKILAAWRVKLVRSLILPRGRASLQWSASLRRIKCCCLPSKSAPQPQFQGVGGGRRVTRRLFDLFTSSAAYASALHDIKLAEERQYTPICDFSRHFAKRTLLIGEETLKSDPAPDAGFIYALERCILRHPFSLFVSFCAVAVWSVFSRFCAQGSGRSPCTVY